MVLRHLTVQTNTKEYFQQHRRRVGVLPPVQSVRVKCLKTSGNLSFHAGLKATVAENATNEAEHFLQPSYPRNMVSVQIIY